MGKSLPRQPLLCCPHPLYFPVPCLKEAIPQGSVVDAMTRNVPTVNIRRCLDEAFRLLQEKATPAPRLSLTHLCSDGSALTGKNVAFTSLVGAVM